MSENNSSNYKRAMGTTLYLKKSHKSGRVKCETPPVLKPKQTSAHAWSNQSGKKSGHWSQNQISSDSLPILKLQTSLTVKLRQVREGFHSLSLTKIDLLRILLFLQSPLKLNGFLAYLFQNTNNPEQEAELYWNCTEIVLKMAKSYCKWQLTQGLIYFGT